jgi:zinc transport system permease protein
MDEFLIRAVAGGLGVALIAGPLGCFLVWRRMAYFGDTLAHSGLLGVAGGVILGVAPGAAVVACCLLLALLLVGLEHQRWLARDTLLGILSHSTLSLGLVALALVETMRVDLVSYLFGDILALGWREVAWIWGGSMLALALLAWLWRGLLAITVDEDLARVEGVAVGRVRLAFMLLVALVIGAAMKVVGILLITSLMIIPAATARRFSATPEAMAWLAACLGALAVLAGVWISLMLDTPTGPSIVVMAAVGFGLGAVLPAGLRGLSRR